MEQRGYLPYSNSPPAAYTVDFPDGRRETFQFVTWDPVDYRVWGTGGITSSAGVRERVQPLSANLVYLVLPDGGKVKFQATQHYQSQPRLLLHLCGAGNHRSTWVEHNVHPQRRRHSQYDHRTRWPLAPVDLGHSRWRLQRYHSTYGERQSYY